MLSYTHKEAEVIRWVLCIKQIKESALLNAYENQSFWDSELKRSRSKRKLIGRVDKETGKIVPTDGRCKKRSPSNPNIIFFFTSDLLNQVL